MSEAKTDFRPIISTLWIVVMINIAMADIFSFMMQAMSGVSESEFVVTQAMMLGFAVIMEIPIAMIFISRILKGAAVKWVNILAAIVTIAFVIVGGSAYLHYYFFGALEGISMALIVWYAVKSKV